MMSLNLELLNKWAAVSTPQGILEWAINNFWPDIIVSSSFQTQSIPLLHIITQIKPVLPVYFLDTGYHFPETLNFKENLQKKWDLNIINLQNKHDLENEHIQSVEPLYRTDPDLCCYLNKVVPMMKELQNRRAWVTGIRREQTDLRSKAKMLECQSNGLIKINPLLNWTHMDIWRYIHNNKLPVHPLFYKGYLSIGCAPCTRPVQPSEDERAGRWADTDKIECGLHTLLHLRNDSEKFE
jgi:phosphoadenosine phosphosulfate reductase